jgi:hypothetical protein
MNPVEFEHENDCAGEAISDIKRQIYPLVRGHMDYDRECSVGKMLIVGLKRLYFKTNWSAVNLQS